LQPDHPSNLKRTSPFLPPTNSKKLNLLLSKEYNISQTAVVSLENRKTGILQQQQIILNDWAEQSRTIDVLDVSKRIANAQLYDQIRESQWKAILHFAAEVQEFLLEIQRQDNVLLQQNQTSPSN
jgi:hypothetical protein